jgi:hypothetical protein
MKEDFNFVRDPKSNGSRAGEENSLYLDTGLEEPPPSFSTRSQVAYPMVSLDFTRTPYQTSFDTADKVEQYTIGSEEEVQNNQYSGRHYEIRDPEI